MLAWINIYSEEVNETDCSVYQTIKFAFHKVSIDNHLNRLRCVTVPAPEVVDQTLRISDEGVIKVVPSKELPLVTMMF